MNAPEKVTARLPRAGSLTCRPLEFLATQIEGGEFKVRRLAQGEYCWRAS